MNIFFKFKRNVPPDIDYEAGFAQKLKGIVSHRTILNMMTSVDDPEYELLELEREEQASYVQLTNPNTPVEELYNVGNLEEGNANESK